MTAPTLPEGLVAVVKRDCPTCELIAPVLAQLAAGGQALTVYVQDDPAWAAGVPLADDTELAVSYHHDIETVPTLIRVIGGEEKDRIVGWDRAQWERFTGAAPLGEGLTEYSPGCGSLSVDPSMTEVLAVRFGGSVLRSRRVEVASLEDEFEAMFDRGWTDGLPVVPPTEARVLRMLSGTVRPPDEVVAVVPPDMVECTVEKVAVNAVLAGAKPEYLPVILAAVEAACTTTFNAHGLLCTTFFGSPVVVVNGPIAKRIGMNSGFNCLGQGNRANATIGRALQLVIRNVGGGRPQEIDRAALGNPGKYTFCFAENEDMAWESLAVERGFAPGVSTVTLFAGHGVQAIVDQRSRTPESLVRSLAAGLVSVTHPKLALGMDAMLVITPEHLRTFVEAGWSKAQFRAALDELLTLDATAMVEGEGGIAEGLPEHFRGRTVPKFRKGGLLVAHAGGDSGMFSGIIGGWAGGKIGSEPITWEVRG
ncbi:MAG: thioredoxin family protein [Acidimicrobiales bacterium]